MESPVRVRFAPSPTGPLHMGGVRTALYNYLFAKKHGGQFLLRIEDTDQTRFVQGAESYILEALDWCGISPDEGVGASGDFGPYRQSERTDIYKQYVNQLIESGNAYYAFDSGEELDAKRSAAEADGKTWQYDMFTRGSMKNSLTMDKDAVNQLLSSGASYTVRIKTPEDQTIRFEDIVRGVVQFDSNVLDDKILFKSNGLPSYHLANVVDDHLMQISHVIRGEEWLPSAPTHVLLYEMLGWASEMPKFAHLPLILKPTGKGKLSKRDGAAGGFPVFPLDWNEAGETSPGFREAGYEAAAFVNMLAFLGWNPGTEKEIYSLEELVADFSLERVGKAGARFDPDKTKWFNQQHILGMSELEFIGATSQALERAGKQVPMEQIPFIASMMKERITFLKDLPEQAAFLLEAPNAYDEKTVKKRWKANTPQILTEFIARLQSTDDFTRDHLEATFKAFVEEKEYGFGVAMIGLRLSLTGMGGGPDLFEIMAFLGKDKVVSRIEKAINTIPVKAMSN